MVADFRAVHILWGGDEFGGKEIITSCPWKKSAMREKPSWHKHQYHSFTSRSSIRPALNRPTETKLPVRNYRCSPSLTSKVTTNSLSKSPQNPFPHPPTPPAFQRIFHLGEPKRSYRRSTNAELRPNGQ